jgi:hypothetical protein
LLIDIEKIKYRKVLNPEDIKNNVTGSILNINIFYSLYYLERDALIFRKR